MTENGSLWWFTADPHEVSTQQVVLFQEAEISLGGLMQEL